MKISFFNIQKTCAFLGTCFLLFLSVSCTKENNIVKKKNINEVFTALYKNNLNKTVTYLDSLNNTSILEQKKVFFKEARKYFKVNEAMISFWNRENVKSLNSPNLLRIHEEDATDIKVKNPIGFQVIEETLFADEIDTEALHALVDVTKNKFRLIANNSKLKVKKHHIIWIIRDQIVRVATTGLSNFDSPVLGQSLLESSFSYDGIKQCVLEVEDYFTDKTLLKNFIKEIESSQEVLKADFDSFDRYSFIKNHTHKQLEMLNQIQKDWNVSFPFKMFLNNEFSSLFDGEMFNITHFSDRNSDTTNLAVKVAVGKKLFNDTRLSKDNTISCASCHASEQAFTDGKVTFNKNIKRNTPTVTYATYQKAFFYDKRAGSLEGQIVDVINNPHEFNSSLFEVVDVVNKDKDYKVAFDSLYKRGGVTDSNIRHAIASYIRSLNSWDSKFDNNINGKENTLTETEIKGFNIFMGKGACATCHFPPTFNGTIPPNFNETELEIIGVPETADNKALDDDLGRYDVYHTEERKFAFKTPSIRNIDKTAPYMHNGVYATLDEVMNFYNRGGGEGLGYVVPNQTLPFDNLDLSEEEINAVIAFMKTLTDEGY